VNITTVIRLPLTQMPPWPRDPALSHRRLVLQVQDREAPSNPMADLSLADKPIQSTVIGKDSIQLPLDVRELYQKLKALSHEKEILPTVIKVSTLAG